MFFVANIGNINTHEKHTRMIMKKLIARENAHLMGELISDSDGVITDFSSAYHKFMREEKNLHATSSEPENFNFSDVYPTHKSPWEFVGEFVKNPEYVGSIMVYPEAVVALKELHEAGVKVRIITAIGDDIDVINARKESLERQIGSIVDDIKCIPLGASKETELAKHRKAFFVDDLPKECNSAAQLGHKSFLFDRKYNQKDTLNDQVQRMVYGWKTLPFFQ